MHIMIVGCGNVGKTLAEQLSQEGHNVAVVDIRPDRVHNVSNSFDVLGVIGNGASPSVQQEAGIEDTDVFIAVTTSDELNLLCCLIAKKVGGCHTIARVRNPVYSRENQFIKEELGLSMIINPELAAAMEISHLLQFPSAIETDSFAKGRITLIKFRLEQDMPLCHLALREVSAKLKCDILVCAVERADHIIIPDGDFIFQEKDMVSFMAPPKKAAKFFKRLGLGSSQIKHAMITGGGSIVYYLANMLCHTGMEVKIIEENEERCAQLSELLPEAMIIQGDSTEKDLLLEEGITHTGAFIALTDFDEENIMLSLFARSVSKAKTVTSIHRIEYDDIISQLDVGSTIYPKFITAEYIIQYVRAMNNSIGSNVETLYRLFGNRVEALEFIIHEGARVTDIPLKELKLKSNLLICSIIRKGKILTPGGDDVIQVGDNVIVVTTHKGLQDIKDILQ